MSSLGIFDKETKTYKKVADLSNIADHDTATSGTSFTDAENGNMLLTDWTKNLLNPTLETVTKNGVTCTNNGDGTYTLNGTASDSVSFSLTSHNDRKGKFKVVGCPKNGSNSTYNILVVISNKSSGTWKSFEEEYGSGIIFENYDDNYVFSVEIQVSKGTTVNNLVFKPIITTDLSATYDDFVPYGGYEIQSCGKNLLNPTLETVTKNGVTCTNNGDGTYTLNGTASDSVSFSLTSHNDRKGKFKVVGCPKNGSNSTYNILVVISNKSSGTWKSFEEEYGSGIIFENYDDNYVFSVEIQVSKGTTVNNLVFKPIITTDLSATYDDFEPYTGETITVTNDTESPAFGLKSHKGITNIISPGNVEVLYAKSEAGAALLGILNDLSVRLDEYINRLDEATNNRVTITADGLDSLADDVAQHQEAILALQSAQSK